MNNFLNKLNKSQKDAVVNIQGASLVIAGAGSGKTRVLTYRIAYLLGKGVKSYRILALTFTNKAAREMKERIAKLIGEEKTQSLWMGTFHSIFAKFLRTEAENIGYPRDFTIYDTIDSKSILKSIIKELKLDDQAYKPASVYSRISKAKNNLVTANAYENNSKIRALDEQAKRPELYKIYKIYAERCLRSGAMDFDDLLLQTNILFKRNPEILKKYQNKFDYILVDEYQDTNISQYLIIKKLAEIHKNICVVGDDAQSIYSFRGAKIENIFNFKKDYKNLKIFKLEQNYRSTKNIVNAANSLIEKNKNKIPKTIFSENEQGNKILISEALTDNEEGFTVVNKILDSIFQEKTEYKDHVILYRTNAQSRIFEEALRRRNIPYKIYGGMSFYQRKEIKDLLAYFRLTKNQQDDEALKRVINYPKRGIGQTTIMRIENYARQQNISLWNTITSLPKIKISLNSRAVNQVFGFVNMIEEFIAKSKVMNAYDIGKEIAVESKILQDLYKDKAPEAVVRYENVQELLNGIKEFTNQSDYETEINLTSFLESVSLLTNEDNETKNDRNKVTLMTIHSAKGLEFRNVYIVGMEERLFPSEMSSHSQKELEEERRLFYVALTRAEKKLVISYAKERYRWGKLNECKPSRFIKDINPKYIDSALTQENNDFENKFTEKKSFAKKQIAVSKKRTSRRKKTTVKSFNSMPLNKKLTTISGAVSNKSVPVNSPDEIKIGIQVEHKRFGYGKIIELSGEYPNVKATIDFRKYGIKKLLLKFAKLKITR